MVGSKTFAWSSTSVAPPARMPQAAHVDHADALSSAVDVLAEIRARVQFLTPVETAELRIRQAPAHHHFEQPVGCEQPLKYIRVSDAPTGELLAQRLGAAPPQRFLDLTDKPVFHSAPLCVPVTSDGPCGGCRTARGGAVNRRGGSDRHRRAGCRLWRPVAGRTCSRRCDRGRRTALRPPQVVHCVLRAFADRSCVRSLRYEPHTVAAHASRRQEQKDAMQVAGAPWWAPWPLRVSARARGRN